jgi:hypothetical protein
VLGFTTHGGGLFPLSLAPFLGAGCELGMNLDLSVIVANSAMGSGSLNLPIPALPHLDSQFLIVVSTQGAATASLDVNVENEPTVASGAR